MILRVVLNFARLGVEGQNELSTTLKPLFLLCFIVVFDIEGPLNVNYFCYIVRKPLFLLWFLILLALGEPSICYFKLLTNRIKY